MHFGYAGLCTRPATDLLTHNSYCIEWQTHFKEPCRTLDIYLWFVRSRVSLSSLSLLLSFFEFFLYHMKSCVEHRCTYLDPLQLNWIYSVCEFSDWPKYEAILNNSQWFDAQHRHVVPFFFFFSLSSLSISPLYSAFDHPNFFILNLHIFSTGCSFHQLIQ